MIMKLLLIIIILLVAFKTEFLSEPRFYLIVLAIALVFYLAPMGYVNENNETITTTTINNTLVEVNDTINYSGLPIIEIELSPLSKAFTKIGSLGSKMWPSHPFLGWTIIFAIGIFLLILLNVIMDLGETVINPINWLRRR